MFQKPKCDGNPSQPSLIFANKTRTHRMGHIKGLHSGAFQSRPQTLDQDKYARKHSRLF